ncbi:TolC family outer membrane protein [Duganella sp. FT94W]|uniref:TolC family outer membrane protein n=1 Tax=Duganella lactea TaxID=2692173 RepID=A0ABW9VD74_9BURK|nr:TolC family outer membrane protein [Duganella lactea]MYM35552.1 TolC family outer membrane protein [Duganella lactea]
MIKHLNPHRLACALSAVLLFCSGSTQALGLMQAYELALQKDPTYREAFYDSEAGKEYRVLGRSALLPTLQGSFSGSKVKADQDISDSLGRVSHSDPEYISRSTVLQLRQPLFSLDAVARYKQGKAQSEYSDFRFALSAQELIGRVTGAYMDALYAEDQVALAITQRDAFAEQQKVNQRLFEKGEGTKTDMLETQARLDLAEAQLIEARDALVNNRLVLAGMIGEDVTALDPLGPTFRIRPLQPQSFEEWKQLALKNNPDLLSQHAAIEAARQEVNKAKAGYTPRLDFIGSVSKGAAESLNTYNQSSTQRSIGIQLNIPLYTGGAVGATTRQAVAGFEKAKTELELRTDKNLTELRKQYNLVLSSAARMAALVKAVESGKLLMTATEQSIKGGVRINLDLLNAQQQLYTSQRDLASARYNYLLSHIRLRAQAGVLSVEDVREIAAYFH